MSNVTYFVQECPTCGRRLHIRVEFLGKRVVCQHCRGRFAAYDPASRRDTESDDSILARAEQLLQTNAHGVVFSRDPNSL
jgi:hypothetical protein